MHEHWFNDWREFKETRLLTPENYEENIARFKRYSKRATGRALRLQVSKPLSRVGQLGDMAQGKEPKDFYFRSGADVLDALAEKLVMVEAGYLLGEGINPKGINPLEHIAATTTSAGMAAIYAVAMELVRHMPIKERKGKRFLQGKTVYTHTNNVLGERMQEMGLEAAIKIDTTQPENVESALRENRGSIVGIFYEPVTNPLIGYTDTRAIHQIAKEYGIPIIVDNTFLTPYLQQPFRMGTDIVVHSMTKYMNGEGDMLGGAVIGPKEFIKSLRGWQTTTGCVIQSPSLALSLFDRVARLSERMEIHVENAEQIAH